MADKRLPITLAANAVLFTNPISKKSIQKNISLASFQELCGEGISIAQGKIDEMEPVIVLQDDFNGDAVEDSLSGYHLMDDPDVFQDFDRFDRYLFRGMLVLSVGGRYLVGPRAMVDEN